MRRHADSSPAARWLPPLPWRPFGGPWRTAALFLLLAGPAAATPVISTFDTDLDGWTVIKNGGGAPTHVATGGNPGGHMQVADADGDFMTAVAPAKFHGDLSIFDGGTVSFDVRLDTGSGPVSNEGGEITITDGVLSATRDAYGTVSGSWQHHSLSLDAADWGLSQAQWTSLLSDVTDISMIVEVIIGDETVAVDNFRIAPEPSTALLLASGLAAFAAKRRRRS